jgi:putative PEP-CTERM system histidine kinase
MISEMFDTLSVNIWLTDDGGAGPKLCGSTVLSEAQIRDPRSLRKVMAHLVKMMVQIEQLSRAYPNFFDETRIRYCLPLAAGGDLVGVLTLGDRVKGESLSVEELDLLQTIANQIAASLLNLKLSEQLQHSKEMEAFQTISAFFVHDLKNLASSLSMTLQNLPNHFDNPEFRNDALRLLSGSVGKINSMCNRLSLLKDELELQPAEADLNDVVKTTLTSLEDSVSVPLVEDFQDLPPVRMDIEHMQKVLTNLVLNANDAMTDGDEIRVSTSMLDGWAMLSVSDDGCGMPEEFVSECLFRPFNTTKKHGTGIGLFHSKMIVEAHQGRMEVESREGVGSTFRVLLPV